jgi:hypothetical protein
MLFEKNRNGYRFVVGLGLCNCQIRLILLVELSEYNLLITK